MTTSEECVIPADVTVTYPKCLDLGNAISQAPVNTIIIAVIVYL